MTKVKKTYDHKGVEEKWLAKWNEMGLFQGVASSEEVKEKLYLLFAFAYPSGSGLHVGHVESKTALDILARYNRMKGKQVFFPVGWDAFGLPAENYAIKTGVHPAKTTKQAIDTFRRQIKRIGISYDWETELATSHPGYYKWTQWIFLKLFDKGMAYKAPGTVNWCPSCQTVLANEQVVEGVCERCGSEVIQKELEQWYFRISDYRDELIEGLDQVDWPKATEQQQKNWIGKSEGVTYKQKVKGLEVEFEAYDSVPQTFMAQSFCVIAPEHPKLPSLVRGTKHEKPVLKFVEDFKRRKLQNRFKIDKEIEGIFTGRYIEDPFGTGDLPIWVATFVIAEYGSGFVNSSAHDERDFAFAKKYDIELRPVMFPEDATEAKRVRNLEYCYHHADEGVLDLPDQFKGRHWGEVRSDVIGYIEENEFGVRTTQYKLRDWLVSRQRYWGVPIPIVYDPEGMAHPVKEEHLPWLLPTDVEFKPTGESPLVNSKEFQERVERLYGKGWRPEYDTMDTFVDSSWYFLRFVDARNEKEWASKDKLMKWLPVDFYMIGPEHIVLHLLYARFFTKFLRDEGYISFDEPFMKMRHQGMILGPDHKKMSKSKGNVIDPDLVIEEYGADTLRMYEMFLGPIEAEKPWSTGSVVGVKRFLDRVNRLVVGSMEGFGKSEMIAPRVTRKLEQTIKKVSEDIEALKFNTAIAAMMEFVNEWEDFTKRTRKQNGVIAEDYVRRFALILAPFAPFLTEEIWQKLEAGKNQTDDRFDSVHKKDWPDYDKSRAVDEKVVIPIQINGKLRATINVDGSLARNQDKLIKLAREDKKVKEWLGKGEVKKEVFVPGKLVNFVVV